MRLEQKNAVVKKVGSMALAAAVLSAAGCMLVTLSACNTTEGVGKDIESAGEGLKEAAQDAKD